MSRILIVVPDNGSRDHWYPMGAVHVARMLSGARHQVSVWHQDLDHLPASRLDDLIRSHWINVVAIGWIAGGHTHRVALDLCAVARRSRARLVIGGHGPSGAPEEYLALTGAQTVFVGSFGERDVHRFGDGGVVQCEGGSAWPTLTEDQTIWGVTGIVGNSLVNEEILPYVAYSRVPAPGAEKTDLVAPVLSGRGCPHHCSFCFRLDDGRVERDVESVKNEVYALARAGFTFVQFQDELLTTSFDRIRAICEALRPLGVRWSCQGRSGVLSRNQKLASLMYEAGCRFINFGIESTNNKVLERMGKRQTINQSTEAVKWCQAAGIGTGLNMLWGLPGDTPETLNDNVDWLLCWDDHSQLRTIRPATPYPGSPLYGEARQLGLVSGVEDFYSKLTNSDLVCFDFTGLGIDRANALLHQANTLLLSNWRDHVAHEQEAQARGLYVDRDPLFRGWRQT